jgi:FkbM family methyltransferase
MFDNLSSTEKLNEWIAQSVAECRSSYPIPQLNHNIAVDIGANVGGFCLNAHRHFKKIYAFEPLVENFLILEKVLNRYDIKNVEAYNTAIYSESNTTLPLRLFSENHSKDVTCAQFDSNELIETNRMCETISMNDMLESLELSHIDYLKLDCEGSEYEILENFSHMDKINVLCLEIHNFFGIDRKLSLMKKIEKTHDIYASVQAKTKSGNTRFAWVLFSIEETLLSNPKKVKDWSKKMHNILCLNRKNKALDLFNPNLFIEIPHHAT